MNIEVGWKKRKNCTEMNPERLNEIRHDWNRGNWEQFGLWQGMWTNEFPVLNALLTGVIHTERENEMIQ